MVKEFQKFSDISEADIKKWKQTKGGLTQVEFPLTDEIDAPTAKFVVCNPPRNILPAITEYGKKQDVEKINELLISNCVLGGDMVYLDDDKGDNQIYLGMLEEVGKRLEPRRSTSKKL